MMSGNVLTISGAGRVVVAANQPGNSTDRAAPHVTQTLVVNQAALTITANNAARVYGTANPSFTGTATGAQDGDTFTEKPCHNRDDRSTSAGTYAIVPSAIGSNPGRRYPQVITNGTPTVNIQAALDILHQAVSGASATPGESVTLTAQVSTATTGTPTGTVRSL